MQPRRTCSRPGASARAPAAPSESGLGTVAARTMHVNAPAPPPPHTHAPLRVGTPPCSALTCSCARTNSGPSSASRESSAAPAPVRRTASARSHTHERATHLQGPQYLNEGRHFSKLERITEIRAATPSSHTEKSEKSVSTQAPRTCKRSKHWRVAWATRPRHQLQHKESAASVMREPGAHCTAALTGNELPAQLVQHLSMHQQDARVLD